MIDAGADVNARNRYDETPLMRAVWLSDTKTPAEIDSSKEVAQLLIEAGADLNAVCRAKGTPLLLAISTKGALQVVELLVSAGADIHAEGALHQAIEENLPKVVKVLLTAEKIDFKRKRQVSRGRSKKTPLELAKHLKRTTIIRLLENAEKKTEKK